ncbi:Caleosin-domain-containing protein [Macrolepiota fuliginosa MF-IS2]|uniref:Caleosin-domain-containing protein n=1 Tax=Macrolepiota fuliginosa MF-IS2 TaxID=1400762 RepID=A0A9P5XE39_9AGAR|nr:Caleosin-domain-containing protein [Macrolepiota fuliginosa MF-IS2]
MVAPKNATVPAPGTGFTPGQKNTALQSHVAFFDRDDDGIIWPSDTFIGMREVKFNLFWTIVAVLVIHIGFSYAAWGSWIPDPFFRLKINRMHRASELPCAKHGSDSESYTTTGEFDENRFDTVFNMYSKPPHEQLSFTEGVRMIHGNMNPFDPFGWFAAAFEWWATYYLIWPEDGYMKKSDVRAVYNGSIFYHISGREPKY